MKMTNEPPALQDRWTHRWSFLHRYRTALLDLLYPRRCEACEQFLPVHREEAAQWLCDACLKALPRIEPPFCNVCGEPFEGAITSSFRCGNCADLKLHFDFAVSAHRADGVVRELVHRFKYQRALHLRGLLSCLLCRALDDERIASGGDAWTLVPVPLFHARQREREYNQAWELCRALSKRTRIPALDAMKRIRPTTPQASLSRNQRIENLRGAFTVSRGVLRKNTLRDKAVLLVDDVLTTGSTTSECARILMREAGVEKVVVITVARG